MVTLKASYPVKPEGETPTGLMYLSEFDQFIAITHANTVYFYRPTGDHELYAHAVEILKGSLSKALAMFYPLAGRLQQIDRGRLQLNCNSMGALFLEAESESEIDDFGDFSPNSKIRALIPSVDYDNKRIHELPLLLVQLTKFSCGGISLGLGISHVLVDGRAASHFVSEWARIARGEQPERLPFLDRAILKLEEEEEQLDLPLPSFNHSEFGPPPILIGQSNSSEERKKETDVAMLKLSKEQIQKLKDKANEHQHTDDGNGKLAFFTRYEAVTAHMWRCACKARGHESEQLTSQYVAVDFRSRVDPPLPEGYFGNAFLPVATTSTAGELLSKPLAYASGKIREAIGTVTGDYVRSSLAYLRREPDLSKFRYLHVVGSTQGAFYGNPNMSITSWTALPLFGVGDFGWGKESYIGPGVLGFDGKSFILPGCDGSLVIPLRLQVAHMDAFKKFFYGDI